MIFDRWGCLSRFGENKTGTGIRQIRTRGNQLVPCIQGRYQELHGGPWTTHNHLWGKTGLVTPFPNTEEELSCRREVMLRLYHREVRSLAAVPPSWLWFQDRIQATKWIYIKVKAMSQMEHQLMEGSLDHTKQVDTADRTGYEIFPWCHRLSAKYTDTHPASSCLSEITSFVSLLWQGRDPVSRHSHNQDHSRT